MVSLRQFPKKPSRRKRLKTNEVRQMLLRLAAQLRASRRRTG